MGEKEKIVCEAVKTACHEYFLNKSTEYIMSRCISFNMPILGVVKPEWTHTFKIENEYQHVTKLTEESYMVYSRMKVADTDDIVHDRFEAIVDATFTCVFVEDEVKFGSVHISKLNDIPINERERISKDENYKRTLKYLYDVIFEYDSVTNSFSYDPIKHRELFQVDAYFVSMDQWFWHMCTECVHPDDTEPLDIFRSNDIGKRIRNNDCVVETEIRIKNREVGYKWVRMVVVFIANKNRDGLERVYVMFKDIDKKKRQEIEYMYKARIDALTGINNREYAVKLIDDYLKENPDQNGVYVILDVDDFKTINDTFGHITGDEILKRTAKVLSEMVGESDVVGRYGGDEFVIFLKNCENDKVAKTKISSILNALKYDYKEGSKCVNIRCSAGATIAVNGKYDLEKLFEKADENLYEAKRAGKDTFRLTGN